MSDSFEKMDEKWMKSMKNLREKEVSDGMLKGFSTSVERRILVKQRKIQSPQGTFSRGWAPVLAVMLLASLVVLRSPLVPWHVSSAPRGVEYAQLTNGKESDIEEEIAALKELGAWNEDDDNTLSSSDERAAQDLEFSRASDTYFC